jgi:hypothetical protein
LDGVADERDEAPNDARDDKPPVAVAPGINDGTPPVSDEDGANDLVRLVVPLKPMELIDDGVAAVTLSIIPSTN